MRLAILSLLLVIAGAGTARAQADDRRGPVIQARPGALVQKIEVIGNKRVSAAAIKAKLRTREGQPFLPDDLSRDIKSITESDGFFIDVQVDYTVLPDGGLVLIFRVKEMNYVESVRCTGVVEESVKEVMKEVEIEPGRFVNNTDIVLKARRLETWYRKKGYRHVEVKHRTRPGRGGGTVIEFQVNEGPLVRVRRIVFRGNRSVSDSELRGRMTTKERGLFEKAPYDREMVEADCVRLQEYCQERGYKDARVTLLGTEENEDFSRVTLVIGVVEGESYLVGSIQVEGNNLFTDEELLLTMRQKAGQQFDQDKIRDDLTSIALRYQEHAYLDVEIKDGGPKLVYALDAPRVNLVYRIREGEKIQIGEIRLEGNEITQDKVILRELTVAPGEWADMREVRRSVARLNALGYFEPRFGVQGPEWKPTRHPTVKNMVLKFKEGRTGHLRMAVGVGSDTGLTGLLSITKENFDLTDLPKEPGDIFTGGAFSGGGQRLSLSIQPGTRVSNYQLSFYEPHAFDTPWGFDAAVFRNRRNFDTFDSDRFGTRFSVTRRLDRDLEIDDIFRSTTAYRWEVIDLSDGIAGSDKSQPQDPLREDQILRINSLEQRFRYMAWDDPLLTTRGWQADISLRNAGGIFGGNTDFNKVVTSGEFGFPIYTSPARAIHVLGVRGQLGWSEEYGDSDFVPLVERFFLGGTETLRGFDYQGVGPRDFNGDPVGGQMMWATSVEYRFPIVKRFLRGVFFWDSGALGRKWGDDEFDKVRHSVGFGFRITLPMFGNRPFALDFGFPVVEEDQDDTRLISFTIGRVLF